MNKLGLSCGLAFLTLTASVPMVYASAFTPGNLVVLRAGDGVAPLAGVATAAFLDEYTPAGTFVQTVAMPTAASGGNNIFTINGSATSEGFLQLSANGQFLTVGGYNATLGTATPNTATAATINRVAGLVGLNGSVDTSTLINAGTSGNIRSATTDNGTRFWIGSSGNGVGFVGAVGGPASSAVQLSTSPANTRVTRTIGGQLYVSSASGTFQGVSTIGSGLPTTSGQTTTILPGFPTVSGPSSYDYFISGNTAWVADDRTSGGAGGVQHWAFDGSTWTLSYTISRSATIGDRGLTVDLSGVNPLIYVTTTDNKVDVVVDTGTLGTSTATTLFSDLTANTAFRGIASIPVVPEPGSIALVGFGLLGLAVFRRSRRAQQNG